MKRAIFDGMGLTKEQIDQIMEENGKDIENARKGEQGKFDAERGQLQGQITDLQGQITQRNTDLADLTKKLEAAQTDAGKLAEVQGSLATLQGKYEQDKKAWEAKTEQQAYEFAVKKASSGLKFSSAAAQRDFERGAIEKAMQRDGDKILGFDDYVNAYKTADPGAFITETPPAPDPAPAPAPTIVLPSGKNGGSGNAFDFHFTGVRPAPKN